MNSEIIIAADIVPTKSNQEYFEQSRMQEIISENLFSVLNSADYRIMNLEVPLTDVISPIQKCGPNLIASCKSINGMKQVGVDLLTLSNNHILDQGEQGLNSTISLLDENKINYVGAGDSLGKACKPFIFNVNDKIIGVYSCAEHEFSIADDNKSGANPFDPLESLDHIQSLKNKCDYVIVLHHGGIEHYQYPSPNLQKVCRKMVEKGADFVVCQHSHCIGCEEKYQNGTIVYGQGNFLFDHSESEFWQTSLLIQLAIDKNDLTIEYIPLVKNKNAVCLAEGQQKSKILDGFKDRSQKIKQANFIENEYKKFSMTHINNYLRGGVPCGFSFFVKVANKVIKSKLFIKLVGKKNKLAVYNYLNCEAHRELYLQGLQIYLDKRNGY